MQKTNYLQKMTDLVGYDRKIIQNKDFLPFSLDSLILSNFVTLNSSVKRVLDLGVGIGPIPLILSLRTNAYIDGVEIQDDVALIAKENVKLNNLEEQVTIYNEDMRDFSKKIGTDTYDVIVCNPPFFNDIYNELPISNSKKMSRHEVNITLEEIFKISKKLLKNNGYFSIIFRTERLVEVLSLYEKYSIRPKRIRFIHHTEDKEAKLFFIEGSKNGNIGLKIEAPFFLYTDGIETSEYRNLLNEVK